jgi:diguanylate cyclase (GGDEF)-like protein
MIAVQDLMTPIGSFANEGDSLADVVAMMRANNHSCVVIGDTEGVRGILTERNLAAVLAEVLVAGDLVNFPVSEVMTPDPVCVHHRASLLEALTLTRSHKLRHLPVINDARQLVGMITHTDMLNAYVSLLEHQTELISTNRELRAQSRQDPLLDIGNRRALEFDVKQVADLARRRRRPYAIVLFDVDLFKKYNDYYGHQAGDLALQQVADAIRHSMRQGDSLYRYGGEELLMLMPDTDQVGALQGADRARVAVESLALVHERSPGRVLTISAGVASGCEEDDAALIAAADKALYRAKADGLNCVCGATSLELTVL